MMEKVEIEVEYLQEMHDMIDAQQKTITLNRQIHDSMETSIKLLKSSVKTLEDMKQIYERTIAEYKQQLKEIDDAS